MNVRPQYAHAGYRHCRCRGKQRGKEAQGLVCRERQAEQACAEQDQYDETAGQHHGRAGAEYAATANPLEGLHPRPKLEKTYVKTFGLCELGGYGFERMQLAQKNQHVVAMNLELHCWMHRKV